jgi:hypothetical protein
MEFNHNIKALHFHAKYIHIHLHDKLNIFIYFLKSNTNDIMDFLFSS